MATSSRARLSAGVGLLAASVVGAAGGVSAMAVDQGAGQKIVPFPRLTSRDNSLLGRSPIQLQMNDAPPPNVAAPRAAELERLFGDRYAGAWDVATAPGIGLATVAVVDPTPADAELAARLLDTDEVQIVRATHSIQELEMKKRAVLEQLAVSGISEYMVGVNVPQNQLTVTVGGPDEVPEAVAQWLVDLSNTDGVSVKREEFRSTSYPNPNQAGQRIVINLSWYCTSGFGMSNAFGKFMTTAAHCATANGQAVSGATGDNGTPSGNYGSTTGWQPGGVVPGDFVAFYKSDATALTYGPVRTVKSAADPTWLEQNVCFRGATTSGERCAGVSDVNMAVSVSGGGLTRQFSAFCVDFALAGGPPLPGDSGSPMYLGIGADQAAARGVLSGVIGTKGCGTPITSITSTYNATVLTK